MQLYCSVTRWRQACVNMWRGLGWSALVVTAIAAAACQVAAPTKVPSEARSEESATTAPDMGAGVSVNRIAFVNATGDLFTIGPEGNDIRPLTGGIKAGAGSAGTVMAQPLDLNNYYSWPTWSPDGTKIATSHVQVFEGQAQIFVEVVDFESARAEKVYENQVAAPIARGAPHYLYWSPDSRYLSFLAVAPEGQTLFIKDTWDQTEAVALETGAPLYFHWAADSESLLIHDGPEVKLASKPFGPGNPRLAIGTGEFRSPALSPDGKLFAYPQSIESAGSVFVAPVSDPRNEVKVLSVGPRVAFSWSPDGQELAIIDQEDLGNDIYQQLRVVSADGSKLRTVAEGPILAFYWSPQGDKLAWVVLDSESRTFEWNVADSAGGPAVQLFRYRPSNDAFLMLAHFDQYAYSHSPWSPDGSRLVVAGIEGQPLGQGNGAAPTGDRVVVLDATGAVGPHDIAAGILAFWSWN